MNKAFYTLEVAGLRRDLPLIKINEELSIASFVILGDTELVFTCAKYLVEKLPDCDVLVAAEAKSIPLVYEMAKCLNMKHYVVARKSLKTYMGEAIIDAVKSITTDNEQILALAQDDLQYIKGKRVVLVDDVISTGASIETLERLVKQAQGEIVAKAAILAEGDAALRKDIIFLEKLPLFKKTVKHTKNT